MIEAYEGQIEDLEGQIRDLQDDNDGLAWDSDGYRTEIYDLEYRLDRLNEELQERSLNAIGQEIWNTCEEKGFHEPVDTDILSKALRLLLIVSEVAEALEAIRKGQDDKHHEEIADVMIRLLHYGASEGIDLDAEVKTKMETNRGRPHKHGKKF